MSILSFEYDTHAHMAHSLTIISHHRECVSQTKLIQLELALIKKNFNAVLKVGDLHGWHCAKVKRQAPKKIEKPSSNDRS